MRIARWIPCVLVAALAGSTKAADDPWAFGAKPSPWDEIELLQRYPLYDDQVSIDWLKALRHEHPLARAAAALAIGRSKPAGMDPVAALGPLLDDDVATVRSAALWALSHWPGPQCRAVVLAALRKHDWQRDDRESGQSSDTQLRRFLVDSGLPSELLDLSLGRRVAWIDEWEAMPPRCPNTPPTEPNTLLSGGFADGWCLGSSVVAMGDACQIRVAIDPEQENARGHAPPEQPEPLMQVFARRAWGEEDPDSGIPAAGRWPGVGIGNGQLRGTAKPERPELHHETTPDGRHVLSVRVVPAEIGAPDVYVLRGEAPHLLFLRVTRSHETEQRVDELLAETKASLETGRPPTETIVELGGQRVQAAGPLFVELLKRSSSTPFWTPDSNLLWHMPRVSDASLLPGLLDLDENNDGKLLRYSQPIVGSNEFAQAAYAKQILNWREELAAGHIQRLALCIGWLSSSPPPEVADAQQALLRAVLPAYIDARIAMYSGEITERQAHCDEANRLTPLLRVLIPSVAAHDTDEAARAIAQVFPVTQRVYEGLSTQWPDEARRRQAAAYEILQFLDLTPRWGESSPLCRAIWTLCRAKQPGTEFVCARIAQAISEREPDALDLLPAIPSDSAEAIAVLVGGRRLGSTAEAVARVEAFLHSGSDAELTPEFRIRFAAALHERWRYSEAMEQAEKVGEAFTNSREMAQVHNLRAACLLALGRVDESADALRAMLDCYKAAQTEADRGDTRTFLSLASPLNGVREPDDYDKILQHWPRISGGWVRPWGAGPGLYRSPVAERDGTVFQVAALWRLLSWDGENPDSEYRFGILPAEPLALAPLSAKEVVVALKDNTAHLYRVGESAPVWCIDLPLGKNCHAWASPSLILAADEEAMLHALSPMDGRELWARPIRPDSPLRYAPFYEELIHQSGENLLLVPKHNDVLVQIEAIEPASGATRWTRTVPLVPPTSRTGVGGGRPLFGLASGDDGQVIVAGEEVVTAIRMSDNTELWSQTLVSAKEQPSGATVKVMDDAVVWAGRRQLACLDRTKGTIRWQCEWEPALKPDIRNRATRGLAEFPPTLCVTQSHVIWLVSSELLVVEAASGKIVLQHPVFEHGMDRPSPVFVRGDRLHFKTQEWRLPMLAPPTASPTSGE